MVLLVFEGALRKWVMPGWSNLLLVARDPIVIAIYVLAAKKFPWGSRLVPASLFLAFMCLLASLFASQFDPVVAAYGMRVNFLHLPLMFVIPCFMHRDDVVNMGKGLMLFSIPVVWMMMKQFDATTDSVWNVGVGGAIGNQLKAAVGDKVRASGPFSFISGPILFFPIVAAFVFNAITYRKQASPAIAISAGAACLLAIPVAISRSLMMAMLVTTCFYLLAVFLHPRLVKSGIKSIILFLFLFMSLGATRIFQESSSYLGERVDSVNDSSGGFQAAVVDRFVGDISVPFKYFTDIPLLGYGLGLGTNAGARYLTGVNTFLLPEGEWGRIVFESGPFLGFAMIALRISIVILGLARSLSCLRRGDALPILLWSAIVLNILNGQWGPPTTLGFAALGGGLMFAACRRAPEVDRLVSRAASESTPDYSSELALPEPTPKGGGPGTPSRMERHP